MNYLKQILSELREKRLWPVALVLILALVAVPTLLAQSSSPAPTAQPPASPASAASPAIAVPAVSVQTTTARSSLKGRGRDPFRQQKLPAAARSASTASTQATPSNGTAASATGGSGTSTGASSAGGSTTTSGTTTSGTSSADSPAAAPLPPVRYYRFATSLTFRRIHGHRRTINDADKFTPLPSARNPVAVFLGLRNDAKTAVFLLSPSASATGKGSCHPTHWSCNFLYLKVGQRELLLTQAAFGNVVQYELDLTRIHPVPTSAPTGTKAARAHVSSAGRQIIKRAAKSLPALRSLTYSTKTGLLRFIRRPGVWLVHLGRLASASAAAVGGATDGGPS